MRLAEVIGAVTLSRPHPTVQGFKFVIATPYTRKSLLAGGKPDGEDLVVYDDLGAGLGSKIAFSDSTEAAAPFYPEKKPIDAYCAALVDSLTITEGN